MRIVRLPGIHHDSNLVLALGALGNILIDSGTSWYQTLQVERIKGLIGEQSLDRILLTSRRYPCTGGAAHIAGEFDSCTIHIHPDGQSSLAKGDFFTTWANRFDSDMPITSTESVTDEDIFPLGDGQISVIALPGHSSDGLGYYVKEKDLLISGPILPRADRPTRWDLPTGCLPDIIESLIKISKLNLDTLIPLQGPAIKGVTHIREVLERHIEFFEQCVGNDGQSPKSWARPAQTAIWLTPHPPWPLTEREDVS